VNANEAKARLAAALDRARANQIDPERGYDAVGLSEMLWMRELLDRAGGTDDRAPDYSLLTQPEQKFLAALNEKRYADTSERISGINRKLRDLVQQIHPPECRYQHDPGIGTVGIEDEVKS
jgi:hypothetical protein